MRRHSLTIAVAVTLFLLAVAGVVASDSAFAQVQTPSQTTTGETTSAETQGESFDEVFWKIFVLSVLVALVWSVPVLVDIFMAYRLNKHRFDVLAPKYQQVITEAAKQELTLDELQELIRAADLTYRPARGMTGLTRSLFAFAVLATISTVLFALIALGRPDDDRLVEGIVAALVGAFTAIVGVYFGSRTAESATETQTANVRHSGLVPRGSEQAREGQGSVQNRKKKNRGP